MGDLTKKRKNIATTDSKLWFVHVRVLPRGRGATPPGRRLWNQGSDSGDSPAPPCPSSPGRPSGLPKDGELSSCPWKERWATGSQTRHWNSPEPWSLRSITGGLDGALHCTPDTVRNLQTLWSVKSGFFFKTLTWSPSVAPLITNSTRNLKKKQHYKYSVLGKWWQNWGGARQVGIYVIFSTLQRWQPEWVKSTHNLNEQGETQNTLRSAELQATSDICLNVSWVAKHNKTSGTTPHWSLIPHPPYFMLGTPSWLLSKYSESCWNISVFEKKATKTNQRSVQGVGRV